MSRRERTEFPPTLGMTQVQIIGAPREIQVKSQIAELRHQESDTEEVPFALGLEDQGVFQGRRAFQSEDTLEWNGHNGNRADSLLKQQGTSIYATHQRG